MKIETSEERLKQDEYGLYINAPNYEDQRARMIHGIEESKKLKRQIEQQQMTIAAILIGIILALLLVALTSCTVYPCTIYKKQKLNEEYTVYYFSNFRFYGDSTLYQIGDTVKDLHEICYPVR